MSSLATGTDGQAPAGEPFANRLPVGATRRSELQVLTNSVKSDAPPPHLNPPLQLGKLTFEIVSTRAAFDALETDWNSLFDRAGTGAHAFQTFNWCWHWTRHYLGDGAGRIQLAIVAGRVDDRLAMVWPLVVEHIAGFRQLVWMGGPPAQYGDVLVDPAIDSAIAIANAQAYLIAHVDADLMRLRLVREDAVIAAHLRQINARITQTYEAPYLDLGSSANFASYETRYPAKARKNRRRLLRRLEERAPTRFETLVATPQAGVAAADAVRMKRRWLASRKLVSKALASDRMIAFLSAVAADAEHPVGCQVSVLRAGDTTASVQISFRCRDRMLLHVIVFDLEYEKSGVGVLHLEHAIARAFAEDVKFLDLLAPRADYKMDWADATTAIADYAVPLTVAGRLFVEAYLVRLRPRLKWLAPHLPNRLRELVSNA